MTLGAFLELAARTPFAWGKHDCCLWLADWLVERGYGDPAADFRGCYRSASGARRLIRPYGGVLGTIAAQAARAGLSRTEAPCAGDVGVMAVGTEAGGPEAGAICTGKRWAMLGQPQLVVTSKIPIAAWRV